MVLYLHQSVKNEGGHTLFFIVLLKQDLHHRVPKDVKETKTLHSAPYGTASGTASIRTRGFWLPDWALDVQYFLTVQRKVHIWRRGRPLWEAEEGSGNEPTARVLLEVNMADVKGGDFDWPRRCHPGWTWPPGSSGLSAGRWQNMFSLQKQTQTHLQPKIQETWSQVSLETEVSAAAL